MRVAIITESFPPDVNGVAHTVLRVAELLTSHGHHPIVIAPRARGGTKEEQGPFPVVRIPAVPLPGYPGFRLGLPSRRVRAALLRHRAAGAEVLTMRLPDPGQMFGLPGALARRMHAVNAAVDEVARRHGTVHLDAACDPAAYERCYWSVDRLHPNERGYRLIACRFHALLAAAGFPVGPGPDPEPSSPPPTRLAEVGWMATKGTAWLVRRSRDLVPALVALALREWLRGSEGRDARGPDNAERDDTERERVNLNVLSKPSGNLRLTRR
jgi:hypothetical protein